MSLDELSLLIEQLATMLDEALCPKIDHAEAFAWIEERNKLVQQAQEFLKGRMPDAEPTDEIC